MYSYRAHVRVSRFTSLIVRVARVGPYHVRVIIARHSSRAQCANKVHHSCSRCFTIFLNLPATYNEQSDQRRTLRGKLDLKSQHWTDNYLRKPLPVNLFLHPTTCVQMAFGVRLRTDVHGNNLYFPVVVCMPRVSCQTSKHFEILVVEVRKIEFWRCVSTETLILSIVCSGRLKFGINSIRHVYHTAQAPSLGFVSFLFLLKWLRSHVLSQQTSLLCRSSV